MRRLLVALLSALAISGPALSQTAPTQAAPPSPETTAETKQDVLRRVNSVVQNSAFVPNVDFKKWGEFVAAETPKIEQAKTDDEFAAALNEALVKFGLSHIVLATPKQATARRTGKIVGIGIQAAPAEGGGTMITRIVEGAPADQAGLKAGDVILEVNGAKANGTTGIAGADGTKLKLKVRHYDKKVEEYELTRRPFSSIRKEELNFIDKETAKLTIWSFMDYDEQRIEELYDQARSAKNLILDLRFNGGGVVANLMHLSGLFLTPEQKLGHMIGRRNYDEYLKTNKDQPVSLDAVARSTGQVLRPRKTKLPVYTGHLVVLVNGGTGSAAEMMAAGLREQAGATVIGSKSAGAVLVSIIGDATNGFTIQYPISDYVTIRGLRLEGNGVVPDVEVKESRPRLPTEPDPCILKALDVFTRAALREQRTGGDKPAANKPGSGGGSQARAA